MTPGTRVFPTRSNPNWLFAAERARAGVVGNTGSLGRLYSAETAETACISFNVRQWGVVSGGGVGGLP